MANSKATKKALFMSMLSLLLCFTMLMGATFAWFTDTVTSTGNRIIAGNLDVDLVMYDKETEEYVSIADGNGDIFSEAEGGNGINWEPGKTEIVYLGVRNLGSLALKYNIILDIIDGEIPLSGSLEYALIDGAEYDKNQYGNWNEVKAAAGEQVKPMPIGTGLVAAENGVLDEIMRTGESEETNYFALAVHMKEEAGNEYQEGEVSIDVTVFATQKDAEEDSFGPEYDEPAPMGHPISNEDDLKEALEAELSNLVITGDFTVSELVAINYDVTINGGGKEISRADGYTGTIFSVAAGNTLTLENIVIDGGAVWNEGSAYGLRSATVGMNGENSGVTATGKLIETFGNANVVLDQGTILQNNDGANAVSLATRGGGTLTLNGAKIINNRSAAGAIWGGGNIIVNKGSKINGNHATSIGGAIRMVDGYNNITFTMNGGEMNYNTSAGNGGAIWGGNKATYIFNGGEMAYNQAIAGGAIWTGTYETYTISGDFKMHDNSAAELGGAIRFCDHASLTMTGGSVYNNTVNGESSAFFLNNNSASITGGSVSDNFSYSGGLGLTIGTADIDGVIEYNLSTNHNTAYLAADFNGFKFTVNEDDEHFMNFNFKPDAGYTYTEGDEAKLVCMNEGYTTYWDATNGIFKLQAN